jgi:phosphoglycolate phosphatase
VRFAAVGWGYTPLEHLALRTPDYQCRHPCDLLLIDLVQRGPRAAAQV